MSGEPARLSVNRNARGQEINRHNRPDWCDVLARRWCARCAAPYPPDWMATDHSSPHIVVGARQAPPMLRRGSQGAPVRALWSGPARLTYSPNSGIDGVFGLQTWHAVVAFQGWSGLASDEIAGARTSARCHMRKRRRRGRAPLVRDPRPAPGFVLVRDGRVQRSIHVSTAAGRQLGLAISRIPPGGVRALWPRPASPRPGDELRSRRGGSSSRRCQLGEDAGLSADSRLVETAANVATIPRSRGFNRAGDLSFDPVGRRVCSRWSATTRGAAATPAASGRSVSPTPPACGSATRQSWHRADPESDVGGHSPDGRWIWTWSGTHLFVYRAADVNPTTAARRALRHARWNTGKDLGSALPTSGVTGAAIYQDAFMRALRLLLALNQGTYSEVISYVTGSARDGSPTLAGSPRSEFTVAQSPLDNESEGLAVTGAGLALNPLGGVLDWQILPALAAELYSQILSYLPAPPPPEDSVSVQRRQRLPSALNGLKLSVVCNAQCTSTATATITGRLARRLGLAGPNAPPKLLWRDVCQAA